MLFERRRAVAAAAPALLLVVLIASACRGAATEHREASSQPQPAAAVAQPDAPHRTADERPRVVVLGDSLTAGLGLPEAQSYPSLLQRKIDQDGGLFEIVNAGISGDTSAGGLRRLEWGLQGNVRVLIVALGANDGLRGLPVAEMKQNLSMIIEAARAKNVAVILAGMEAPPNYGAEYAASFRQVYSDVARHYHVVFIPFLLDKVAGEAALNQGDGIHPNAAGASIVADTVWHALKPVLDQIAKA
jgi:acyl-CoA thioesterase-1